MLASVQRKYHLLFIPPFVVGLLQLVQVFYQVLFLCCRLAAASLRFAGFFIGIVPGS